MCAEFLYALFFLRLCTALLQMQKYCEKVDRIWKEWYLYVADEMSVCHCPRNLSDSCVTRHVDYRHIFQNVSTGKNACPCIVIKTNLFVCLGGMGQVFPVSCKVVCWWVTTNCCFVGDMFHGSSVSWAIVEWISEVRRSSCIM